MPVKVHHSVPLVPLACCLTFYYRKHKLNLFKWFYFGKPLRHTG
jgi:hypothetical protein